MSSSGPVRLRPQRRLPATCCGCLDLRTGCLVIASALIVIEIVGSVGSVISLSLLDRKPRDVHPKLEDPLHKPEVDSADGAGGRDGVTKAGAEAGKSEWTLPGVAEDGVVGLLEETRSVVTDKGGGRVSLHQTPKVLSASLGIGGQQGHGSNEVDFGTGNSFDSNGSDDSSKESVKGTVSSPPSRSQPTDAVQTPASLSKSEETAHGAPSPVSPVTEPKRNLVYFSLEDAQKSPIPARGPLLPSGQLFGPITPRLTTSQAGEPGVAQSHTSSASTSNATLNRAETVSQRPEPTKKTEKTAGSTSRDVPDHTPYFSLNTTADNDRMRNASFAGSEQKDIVFTVEEARYERSAANASVVDTTEPLLVSSEEKEAREMSSISSSGPLPGEETTNVLMLEETGQLDHKSPTSGSGHPAEGFTVRREMSALAMMAWRVLLAAALILVLVTIACNVALLVGAHRDSSCCVLVWLVWHGAVFIASTIGAVISAWEHTSASVCATERSDATSDRKMLQLTEGLSSKPEEIMTSCRGPDYDPILSGLLVAAGFSIVAFYWYCFVVVLSFHMELRQAAAAKSSA